MTTEMKACSKCGATHQLIFAGLTKKSQSPIIRDELGRRWYDGRCNACHAEYQKRYRRSKGIRDRSMVSHPTWQKAMSAEAIAATHFESLGYVVTRVDMLGPDLTISKDGITQKVEVKSVVKNGGGRFWVHRVLPRRTNDDFVAIVMPSGRVHVEPMREHLSKCGPAGTRAVTGLVRPYVRKGWANYSGKGATIKRGYGKRYVPRITGGPTP